MKLITYLFILCFALATTTATAQIDKAKLYAKYLKIGEKYQTDKEYYKAIKQYNAARIFATTDKEKELIDSKIQACAKYLERQKAEAEAAEKRAVEAQQKMEVAQAKMLIAVLDKAIKTRLPDWKGAKDYEGGDWLKIDTLDLSNNELTELPYQIVFCKNLKSLNLLKNSDLNWKNVSGILMSLKNLNDLKVEVFDLDCIPKPYHSKIKGITLLNRNKSTIPANLLEQKQLTYLKIKGLDTLSSEIGKLINLTTLDLSENNLRFLPSEIGKLTNLTTLDLSNNSLTTLPSEIGKLASLRTLNLFHNKLIDLPIEIKGMTNLTTLNLGINKLTYLPKKMEFLPYLTSLLLAGNKITSLPKLANLIYLDLYANDSFKISMVSNSFKNSNKELFYTHKRYYTLNKDTNKLIINLPDTIYRNIEDLTEIDFNRTIWTIMDIEFCCLEIKNYDLLKRMRLRIMQQKDFNDFGSLARYCFTALDFEGVIWASKRLLETDNNPHIAMWLGLGYLWNGNFDEAKEILLKYKDEQYEKGGKFKDFYIKILESTKIPPKNKEDIENMKKLLME